MRAASQNRAAGSDSSARPLSPRRPDISVRNTRGVHIESNDDAARIYPTCVAISGPGRIEACVGAVAPQKGVSDIGSIRVEADDVSLGINASIEGEYGVRKVIGSEVPMAELVAVSYSTAVCVGTNHSAEQVHSGGKAAGRVEGIELGDLTTRGDSEALVRGCFACGIYQTGKSRQLAPGIDAGESRGQRAGNVKCSVVAPIQNEAVSHTAGVEEIAHDHVLRVDVIGRSQGRARGIDHGKVSPGRQDETMLETGCDLDTDAGALRIGSAD